MCEQDFGALCPIDWVLVGNIYNDIALLETVMMDRVQTRRSELTVGHQRGKCTGSNCVRPSGLASVGCVCLMYSVCWVGNIFCCSECERCCSAACPDGWSADDRNVCHVREIRRVLKLERMGFLITTVCFLMSAFCRREQGFKLHNTAMKARWSDDCDAWWPCTRFSV